MNITVTDSVRKTAKRQDESAGVSGGIDARHIANGVRYIGGLFEMKLADVFDACGSW